MKEVVIVHQERDVVLNNKKKKKGLEPFIVLANLARAVENEGLQSAVALSLSILWYTLSDTVVARKYVLVVQDDKKGRINTEAP